MRVIKRYPNRKLYDTTARQYVTLQAIRDLVGQGETVQVVDSRTGKDVTKGALSKIVLENEMNNGGGLPASFLTELIKKPGKTVMGFLKKGLEAGATYRHWAEGELDKSVKNITKAAKGSLSNADELRQELTNRFRALKEAQETAIKSGVEKALHTLNLPTRGDMDNLQSRLSDMESRLDGLLGNGHGAKGKVKVKNARKKA
jgi:polyhydroxyalkanoate synthesis repressor PhaR